MSYGPNLAAAAASGLIGAPAAVAPGVSGACAIAPGVSGGADSKRD